MVPSSWKRQRLMYRYQPASISLTTTTSWPSRYIATPRKLPTSVPDSRMVWPRAPADSRGDIRPIRLDHALLELPVAVGAAGVAIVLDVEYRGMGLVEHEFATVHHIAELDAGSVCPRGCGGSDHEETPERGAASVDGNLVLAGCISRSGALARIG